MKKIIYLILLFLLASNCYGITWYKGFSTEDVFVPDNVDIDGRIDVDGDASLDNVTIDGTLTQSGGAVTLSSVTVNGGLTVQNGGITTLLITNISGNVGIVGDIKSTGTVENTGDIICKSGNFIGDGSQLSGISTTLEREIYPSYPVIFPNDDGTRVAVEQYNDEGDLPNYEISFNSTTLSYCIFNYKVGEDIDDTPILELTWVTSATSGQVQWAVSFSTFDTNSTSFLTAPTTAYFPAWDVNSNAEGINISTYAVSNYYKLSDYVKMGVIRDPADADDTALNDVRIINVRIYEE